MQVRGYLEEFPPETHDPESSNIESWSADEKIARDLFELFAANPTLFLQIVDAELKTTQ